MSEYGIIGAILVIPEDQANFGNGREAPVAESSCSGINRGNNEPICTVVVAVGIHRGVL